MFSLTSSLPVNVNKWPASWFDMYCVCVYVWLDPNRMTVRLSECFQPINYNSDTRHSGKIHQMMCIFIHYLCIHSQTLWVMVRTGYIKEVIWLIMQFLRFLLHAHENKVFMHEIIITSLLHLCVVYVAEIFLMRRHQELKYLDTATHCHLCSEVWNENERRWGM